ncbi:MAG TPA: hypothetical protein PLG34_10905 [Spirochaetota bacterium]|jgi:hypothetical protein|nr:MAG: hypothetical protein BWX91_01062 [Spirochaetes bacterium ADurb.Bin133]HPY88477.1 hypothetical protein [Spirochaetota bacterium]HQB61463.1 hypothetical protein [Spirochaetota bacterium]
MLSTYTCFDCEYYNHYKLDRTCKAFPKGIPFDISIGKVDHNNVLPNQEGNYIFNKLSNDVIERLVEKIDNKNKYDKRRKASSTKQKEEDVIVK